MEVLWTGSEKRWKAACTSKLKIAGDQRKAFLTGRRVQVVEMERKFKV
jgi:hypothetical protein